LEEIRLPTAATWKEEAVTRVRREKKGEER
jgi:hypothetical protein